MKRRSFLQRAGIAIAGGATTTGAGVSTAHAQAASGGPADDLRTVLITSAAAPLCRQVAGRLSDTWRVRLTGSRQTETDLPLVLSDLGHGESTGAAVQGVDAVVHLALPPSGVEGPELIDFRTRGTYNLLRAAAEQGVRRVVYLGSLAPLLGYEPRFMITEDFRPESSPDAEALSHYLGEFTCREFARSGQLEVVVLRAGRWPGSATGGAATTALPRTEISDLARAAALALGSGRDSDGRNVGPWQVVHIHSEADSTRFPLARAERLLGYRPQSSEDAR
jgi:nucleoside-diphosphate-sugar epimerase